MKVSSATSLHNISQFNITQVKKTAFNNKRKISQSQESAAQ